MVLRVGCDRATIDAADSGDRRRAGAARDAPYPTAPPAAAGLSRMSDLARFEAEFPERASYVVF